MISYVALHCLCQAAPFQPIPLDQERNELLERLSFIESRTMAAPPGSRPLPEVNKKRAYTRRGRGKGKNVGNSIYSLQMNRTQSHILFLPIFCCCSFLRLFLLSASSWVFGCIRVCRRNFYNDFKKFVPVLLDNSNNPFLLFRRNFVPIYCSVCKLFKHGFNKNNFNNNHSNISHKSVAVLAFISQPFSIIACFSFLLSIIQSLEYSATTTTMARTTASMATICLYCLQFHFHFPFSLSLFCFFVLFLFGWHQQVQWSQWQQPGMPAGDVQQPGLDKSGIFFVHLSSFDSFIIFPGFFLIILHLFLLFGCF